MRAALLGLLLVGCAHLRVKEQEAPPSPPKETGFTETLPPPSLEGAVASIGTTVPYGLRKMTLNMDRPAAGGSSSSSGSGCSAGVACFASTLTLTDTLTGTAATMSGVVTALNLTTTALAGQVGIQMVQSSKLCFNGTNACLEYGGGTTAVQANNDFEVIGNLKADADLRIRDQIHNDTSGAACSSNTGAVCVDDAQGFAVANGSGTTGITAIGTTVTAERFTSNVALGGLGFVLPNGVYLCFNSTTCTSYMRYDNTNADVELVGGTAITLTGATTVATSLKVGTGGTAMSAIIHDSESVNFGSLTAPDCDDANTTHTGITTSSQAIWDFPVEWYNAAGSIFNARIVSTGNATIRHCCVVGTCDPDTGTVEVRWINN